MISNAPSRREAEWLKESFPCLASATLLSALDCRRVGGIVKSKLRILALVVAFALTLSIGVTGGVVLDRFALVAYAQPSPASSNTPNFSLIQDAWNTINREYVDRAAVQSQPLTYGAISGMVNALGDTGHSTFLTPQMLKQENNFTQGEFEGVGLEVQTKDGHVVIIAPIDGSPAQHAGLRAGEMILKVNGADISGLPLDQVVQRILGPAGTTVTLTILDPQTGQSTDYTLTRAKIALQNVTWQRVPGTTIADVRIAAFSQGVSQELQKALAEIKQQGLTGIVLDLRNDPGGLLDEAVNTDSQFLKSGNVLLEKDAQGKITPVGVETGRPVTDLPMVVLVNNGTASASEIVAGALQDAHRATLIGETTFGTGTVLNQFGLPDGSALLLATEEWLTPNGRVIWHKGITPDQVVALPAGVAPVTPDMEQSMTAAQVQASGDQQLLDAINTLVPLHANATRGADSLRVPANVSP